MIITRPRGPREYIPQSERELPPEEQTKFMLVDLAERDRAAVMDEITVRPNDMGGTEVGGSGSRVYKTLKGGLRGWTGLKYPDGDEVIYTSVDGGSKGVPSDESLQLLPWGLKVEIETAILKDTFLDEEDVGK